MCGRKGHSRLCSTAEQEVGLCTEAARSSGQEPPAPLMGGNMKTISTCVRRKGALIATTGKIQRDVTMFDVFLQIPLLLENTFSKGQAIATGLMFCSSYMFGWTH